jgi:hypothetical protein
MEANPGKLYSIAATGRALYLGKDAAYRMVAAVGLRFIVVDVEDFI